MERLFEIGNDNKLTIKPEALCIPAYNAIWERDSGKFKETAIKEFSYIWFRCSLDNDNPYKEYLSGERDKRIIEDIMPKSWKADKVLFDAIQQYEKNNYTFNVTYLNATMEAAKKTIDYFKLVDYNECNDKGIYKYKVKEVLSAIKETNHIIKELTVLGIAVNSENNIDGDNRIRGEGKLGGFEK